MITTVLFDLDGTLLPMNQDVFIGAYLSGLTAKMAPFGFDPREIAKAIWAGTGAMVKNDGSTTNEEAFWKAFGQFFDKDVRADEPLFTAFYENEFENAKSVCGYSEDAKKLVDEAAEMGYKTILATNPIFPAVATKRRMQWAGFCPEDFELYTTYENIGYCKPNLQYYKEILERIGVPAEECLMIGNDVTEDMVAEKLGMKVFLLTDCMINKENKDISVFPNGSFAEAIAYIEQLA